MKWETSARTGIFAGYDLAPGQVWNKRYKVWDLDDFKGKSLSSNVPASVFGACKPHSVRRIRRPPGETKFPLLSRYLHDNETLEGREAADEHIRQHDDALMAYLLSADAVPQPSSSRGAEVEVTIPHDSSGSVDPDGPATGGDPTTPRMTTTYPSDFDPIDSRQECQRIPMSS